MKNIFLVTIIAIGLLSCNKDNELNIKTFSDDNENKLFDLLMKGYTNDTVNQLTLFLDNWNSDYKSNEDSVNEAGGITKDVYEIFKLVYKPFNIDDLGNHEWENIYTGAKYIVVQNYIFINDNLDSTTYERGDSIGNFKPDVNFPSVKVLYLSPKYKKIIYSFLSQGKEINMMEGYDEETMKRAKYLYKGLYIFPGHWGGMWHIITHPEVSSISFNASKTKARASFRVVYMFGDAEFEKIDGNWKMVKSSINAIE